MSNKVRVFQGIAGACDACTGALLVFAPVWTLRLMGVGRIPQPGDVTSFVGIFVMAVGLSYFLVREDDLPGWRMQWKITALVRLCVACFLAWKIWAQGWEMAWATVLMTDLMVAGVQVTGLKRQWLGK